MDEMSSGREMLSHRKFPGADQSYTSLPFMLSGTWINGLVCICILKYELRANVFRIFHQQFFGVIICKKSNTYDTTKGKKN